MSIKVVVPISGGKDSQVCLKLALKIYKNDEILGLFTDTQFEHFRTYLHIMWMQTRYGVQIEVISTGSVPEKIIKHGRFPGGTARFCTEELKLWPAKYFYRDLAKSLGHGFEVWIGVRKQESSARAKRYLGKIGDELYAPHDYMKKFPKYLAKAGVMFRLPVIDWTTIDILDYLAGEENILYSMGFDRVGCFPCLASGDKWKKKAFIHDETGRKHYNIVLQLEKDIGKSVWTSKSGQAENSGPGCSFCSI